MYVDLLLKIVLIVGYSSQVFGGGDDSDSLSTHQGFFGFLDDAVAFIAREGPASCPMHSSHNNTHTRALSLHAQLKPQAVVRTSMGTGTLDLEGRGLTSLAAGLFDNDRALAAVTRAKLSDNKFQVCVKCVCM